MLGVIQFGFSLISNTVFLVGGFNAAKTYHKSALRRLMHSPMGFFDSQPIGRILNRMSKDIESIDQQIWLISFLVTISFGGLIASATLLIYTNYVMSSIVVPLFILYGFMLIFYQRRFFSVNLAIVNLSDLNLHCVLLYMHLSARLFQDYQPLRHMEQKLSLSISSDC